MSEARYAEVEYDGSIWVGDKRIRLAVSDEYRGRSYIIEMFNGAMTINFPFGRYYLGADEA